MKVSNPLFSSTGESSSNHRNEYSNTASDEESSSSHSTAASSSSSPMKQGKVGTWMLVGLTYYAVSGGPLGSEVAVKAAGPAIALLGFLVMPLFWSVPEAAMTAELSIVYPEAAGFSAWVNAAFGPFWSFQCSMLHYVSGVIDNAVYPGLMLQYITSNGGVEMSEELRYICIIVFTILMTYLTWRGLDVNGMTCVVLTGFILLPFCVFTIIGIPQVDPSNWFLGPVDRQSDDDNNIGIIKYMQEGGFSDIDWRTLLNCLFWNLNYYDSASAFSGDCIEPEKTFPRAMFYSIIFVSITYLAPLMVSTGADPNAKFCDGCFVSIATDVAGPWLGYWITVSAAISCIGLFIAEMASDSFQIMGMADVGQLPKFLSKRSQYGTPTIGVMLSAIGIIFAAPLNFTAIIELVNILYIFAELIEFATFIKLRIVQPDLKRAWKVPIDSWFGYSALFGPPCIFLTIIFALSSLLGMVVTGCVIVASVIFYVWICLAREFKWIEFEEIKDGWNISNDPHWVQWLVNRLLQFFERRRCNNPSTLSEPLVVAVYPSQPEK